MTHTAPVAPPNQRLEGHSTQRHSNFHNGYDKSLDDVTLPSSNFDEASGNPHAAVTSGQLWAIDQRRRNGLILIKPYYAEFAGPGAAVGGKFDLDCLAVVPLGRWRLTVPSTSDDRQTAYRIRLQWLRLTSRFTSLDDSRQRCQKIIEQFEQFFDRQEVLDLSPETLADLVGVLPTTMARFRSDRSAST